MTDQYTRRRKLWHAGKQVVAAIIEDTNTGFPYRVTDTDQDGVLRGCRHTNHTCRQRTWDCAEKIAAHPDTARVVIADKPRRTR